jgi:16S rRNA (uracil1498-N3)-methyltransferase
LRIHRIFTQQDLAPGENISLTGESAHYLSRVLRVTAGQSIVLFNGDGSDYAADITQVERKLLGLEVQTRLPARSESHLQITLVQAVSRGERMDLTLQKATELGVASIQPVFSLRAEVKLKPDKLEKRMAHWRKVIISACEQSGRAFIPSIRPVIALETWAETETDIQRLMLEPTAELPLARLSLNTKLELLIGPEGGFDDRELEQMSKAGVTAVCLGPRILRTETAGLAAIAVLQALAGDFA